jgi:D-alanyl-D-alanine carboxypeptidase
MRRGISIFCCYKYKQISIIMKKVIGVLVISTSILFAGCSKSDKTESPDALKATQTVKDLDTLLPKYLSNKKDTPLNNIIIYVENENKGLVYHKAFGFRNEEKTEPAEKQNLFKTASVSKTFTAAVIMQMAEEGKFSLNDPVSKYIGDNSFVDFDKLHLFNGKSYGRIITIAQALSHTSGISDIFEEDPQMIEYILSNPQQQWTPKTLFEKFYELGYNTKAKFIPGAADRFNYSDVNYFLLGLLIEKVSNNSYQAEVRKRVLLPLEMTVTYFEYREPKKSDNKFVETFFGDLNVTRNMNTSFDWAGGGYVTTVLDFKKFIRGLMANKLFKNATTLNSMITNHGGAESSAGAEVLGYGYGIYILKFNGSIYYGHGGFWGTYMLYCPEKKITLCLSLGQVYFNSRGLILITEIIKKIDY